MNDPGRVPSGSRFLRTLLGLAPVRFRREYGSELIQAVESRWAEESGALGMPGRVRFWLREGWAVAKAGIGMRIGTGAYASRSETESKNRRRGWMMMGFREDMAQATKGLRRAPGFAAMTVLTLGLGIGAATTVFSAVSAVLLRPLPYADADRIVTVFHSDLETGARSSGVSAANMRDLGDRAELLEGAAAAEPWSLDLLADGRTESLRTWAVSEDFFTVLGARPLLGRLFTPDEFVDGRDREVVLGYGAFVNRFGGDPAIVGRTVTLDGEAYHVAGVLPHEFGYPDRAAAWIPRPDKPWDDASRSSDYLIGVARLRPDASLEEAREETRAVSIALSEDHPETMGESELVLVPLRDQLVGDVRTPLWVLMGAVAFLLLIACANVASLMLARGARRGREYALRGALGADRRRLARLIGAESLAVAAMGCAVGIGLAYLGIEGIRLLGPDHLPRLDGLRVDPVVLAFAVATSGFSALVSGIAPVARLSRPDLRGALAQGGRGSTVGVGGLRRHLVVLQVSAALVLLIGGGLLVRSFLALVDEELGFNPENRVAVQVFAAGYPPGELGVFVQQAVENMEAIPGVESVALTSTVPGANDGVIAYIDIDLPFRVEGASTDRDPVAFIVQVSSGYFDLMEIPTLAGRGFLETDGPETTPVMIVNEAMARRHFPGREPASILGERIAIPWGGEGDSWTYREVVGVVRDVRPMGFESAPRPEMFVPLGQLGTVQLTFVLLTTSEPTAAVGPAREAIWQANPTQSIWGAATLESLMSGWLRARTFNVALLGSFGILALLLSLVGVYGLVNFSVSQRTGEMGVRRALGGSTPDVLRLVLWEGARLGVAGIFLGVVLSLGVTRVLGGMLYGVPPIDPATFLFLAAAVLGATVLAALPAALRATLVDPSVALREQ